MTNDVKQTIDWGKPIEAVHEDGRVSPLWLRPPSAYGGINPDIEGQYWTDGGGLGRSRWNADGSGNNSYANGWRIRNATPAAPEWGPPIPVDGKRPEWLGDKDYICWVDVSGYEHGPSHPSQKQWATAWTADMLTWRGKVSIRLPANHPYYTRTPTIPAALVERMQALMRRMADSAGKGPRFMNGNDYAEARAIVADPGFPVEVDEETLEVRKLVEARGVDPDSGDYYLMIGLAEDALRRGRALARGEG